MDLSSMLGGLGGSLDGIMGDLKDKVAGLGLSSELVDELTQAAKDIAADGTVTKDEVVTKLKAIAEKHGAANLVPESVLSGIAEKFGK